MPSDLQRVARGLVDCLDEAPQVIQHLQRTADRCRENAQVALTASQGRATVAAQQLDAAARACEAAAHYLSMAPPKARAWAERLIGDTRTTNRPSSDSADRNKATGGKSDVVERDTKGRAKRLTATYEDLDLPEETEPPLITVARKAFERFRKQHEKDEEHRDEPEELEIEITVTETGDLTIEERNEKQHQQREDRLLQDFQITADLTEAARALLEAMSKSADQTWDHALLTITPNHVEATFDYPEEHQQPIAVDIELPELASVRGDERQVPDVAEPALDIDAGDVEGGFVEYREQLVTLGRIRPAVGFDPEAEFQRKHCGPIEFRLTLDERLPRAVWADSLDDLLRHAQDAKYVAPTSGKSCYRPDSLPPFLRKIAEEKNDHMLLKYREVIGDGVNPVEGLEIITNDEDAAAYFRDRMQKLDVPGHVTLTQWDDS
ncbi:MULTISPECIES: restriction endonuclease fold toxin-2 domain-containing protein [unclassified Kribbella]|uniref:restriction endonuclease fold toxin-2 domain-containing protein n=1 Tax=unclassified Kribbella TaxID=2644121 RepID=UPI0030181ADA